MHAPSHQHAAANSVRLRYFTAVSGGACALLGCLALLGWHLDLPVLVQLRSSLAPMQYNTAICLVLAGSALAIWAWGRVFLAVPIIGGIVAAIAGLTLAEYLFHADFGIDQCLFRSYITTETFHAGRMSPVSAFCLTLASLSLLSLGPRVAPHRRALIIGSLSSIIVSISGVALVGYALGLPGAYGWGQLTRMAINTSVGLGLLGAALFIIAWHIDRHPGENTPRWLPLPLALSVFTGSLVLYFALEQKQDQDIVHTVKAGAESVKNQIALRMEGRMRGLVRMARRWRISGDRPQAEWEADAADYVHDVPDAQALEWIDAAHLVRWVVPLAGNEKKLNLDLTREERRKAATEQAERENQAVITSIVTLFRGELGFVIYVPLLVDGRSQGFLAGTFDAKMCLDRYLPPMVAAGESIRISDHSRTFYERDAGAPSAREDWVVREKIELHAQLGISECGLRPPSPHTSIPGCRRSSSTPALSAPCSWPPSAFSPSAPLARPPKPPAPTPPCRPRSTR